MMQTKTRTTPVSPNSPRRGGVTTLRSSMNAWLIKSEMRANGLRLSARSFRALATMSSLGSSITLRATLTTFHTYYLQGGQDLNLQPAVLETAALPIEPPP